MPHGTSVGVHGAFMETLAIVRGQGYVLQGKADILPSRTMWQECANAFLAEFLIVQNGRTISLAWSLRNSKRKLVVI